MKRLSEGQIKETIAPMSQPHGHPAVLIKVAQAQFQADRESIKASREKIANQLMDWFTRTQKGEFIGSFEAADQIINLLEEE